MVHGVMKCMSIIIMRFYTHNLLLPCRYAVINICCNSNPHGRAKFADLAQQLCI